MKGFRVPLFRLYRSTRDGMHALLSPTFRYRRRFENTLLGHDREVLNAFLERKFLEVSPEKARGRKLAGVLLRARIRRDYYQFLGSFSEALQHRIAFQRRIRSDWKTSLSRDGRRERLQIAIEWMETPALSFSDLKSELTTSRPFFGTGSRGAHAQRDGGHRGLSEAEDLFFAAVRGKRVLVLGPGITEPLDQEKVRSFDVLATPKLHSGFWAKGLADPGADSPFTVVTYLNHKIVNAMRSTDAVTGKVWDFARVKSAEDARTLERVHAEVVADEPVIGVMNSPDHLLMNSYGPLMGTAMVFDLLLARPKSVFLMGFSFFVQEGKAYNSNYESATHTDQFTLNSLRAHGAFSNFLFLKNLYLFGLIEADVATAQILSLTSSEYAERLDFRFGLRSLPNAPKNFLEG